MLSFRLSSFPVLSTKRLILKRIEKTDAPELLAIRSDDVVMKYMDSPKMKSIEEAIEKIKSYDTEFAGHKTIQWGIYKTDDPRLIGTICLWHIQLTHYRAEIGYMLHSDFHRQGLMQEAVTEVIRFAFEDIGFHSIEAQVNPFNNESIGLLKRNGFVKEAHFKENYFWDGVFLDTAVYSLVKPNS